MKKRSRDTKMMFIEIPSHSDSLETVKLALIAHIFKKASLSPLGINLNEYMDPSPSHQSGSVGTVRFPLTWHILKNASLSPLVINLIWIYDLFYSRLNRYNEILTNDGQGRIIYIPSDETLVAINTTRQNERMIRLFLVLKLCKKGSIVMRAVGYWSLV